MEKKKKKNLLASAGDRRDMSSIPELGRCTGIGNGNQLQYSCLEYSTDRDTWKDTIHGVAKSPKPMSTYTHRELAERWRTKAWTQISLCHFLAIGFGQVT